MAKKTKIKNFDAQKWGDKILKAILKEQTKRLVEYAREKIVKIGNRIEEYHAGNHMDRTGNLLDSLCWGVSYGGKLLKSGFYRRQKADKESYLHEFFSDDISTMFPVYGRGLAERYLQKYGNNGRSKGFRVFFAILAPYWGYWEKGFTMRGSFGTTFMKFSIMAEFYDEVKAELKPARVRFRSSVNKYDIQKLEDKAERLSNSPYAEKKHFDRFPKFKKRKKR